MEKINFTNGQAPAINGSNLNQLQTNVEEAINEIVPKTDKNIITAKLASSYTLTKTSEYEKLKLTEQSSVGDILSMNDDGQIVIPDGVTKVIVSGVILWNKIITSGTKHAHIVRNNTAINHIFMSGVAGETTIMVFPPILADVTAGNLITLEVYSNSLDIIDGNANARTYLTVEVVE